VSTRTRPRAAGEARIASTVRLSASPLVLLAATMVPMFRLSIAATSFASASGVSIAPGWPWKSTAGYFARGTMCSAVTSVERGR
jgi:hypothetical protein